jgi:hypothetical protein
MSLLPLEDCQYSGHFTQGYPHPFRATQTDSNNLCVLGGSQHELAVLSTFS